MGNCLDICNGASNNIEGYLTDFIDELEITKYKDNDFFAFIEKNPPLKYKLENFNELLKSNDNEPHKNYKNNLFTESYNHLFASLIFLMKSEPEVMATSYKAMIQKIKNSEISKENLDSFKNSDHDILYDVLRFYIEMVSLSMVEAICLSKINILPENVGKLLRESFSKIMIDQVAKDLMKDCKNPDVNIDEFFEKNYAKLMHPAIRAQLRNKHSSIKNENNEKKD